MVIKIKKADFQIIIQRNKWSNSSQLEMNAQTIVPSHFLTGNNHYGYNTSFTNHLLKNVTSPTTKQEKIS